MATTVTMSVAGGARLLSLPRTLAATSSSFIKPSKWLFCPLQRIKTNSNKLVVRAARIESKGVSLGFRAPEFELLEPLTRNTWKLEDFEACLALLIVRWGHSNAVALNSTVCHASAVCTPEFFLFKKGGRRPFELVYHGQFDDSLPSNNMTVTGRDLSQAIDLVLSGQPVPSVQKPSVGCSIKWHP